MRCLGDGVQEPVVGVGREVHKLPRPWGDSTSDLDVEQHFTVGTVRILARHVGCTVDADRRHLRRAALQTREIRVEIALPETAAQFDDGDRLPGTVAVRHVVDGGELDGRVADGGDIGAGSAVPGARLRPVVQAEDCDERAGELGRQDQLTDALTSAHPVAPAHLLQQCAEQRAELPAAPRTRTSRVAKSAVSTCAPAVVTTQRTDSRSAGSAPKRSASCWRVSGGPAKAAASGCARRRSTSVASICVDASIRPAARAPATCERVLPGNVSAKWSCASSCTGE